MNEAFETIEAIKGAILREDNFFNGVQLPIPQRAGTITQCVIYAKMEAQKIYEKHFRNK